MKWRTALFVVLLAAVALAPVWLTPLVQTVHKTVTGPPDPIPVRLTGRTESLRLSEFAQKHADFCVEHNQFLHSRIGEAVSRYGVVHENIARAHNWSEAFALWEMSPPHAANLRDGGPYIGFASRDTFYILIFAEKP